MKITTSQSEYTIDENEIINDSLSHCDICNDIAGMHVEDEEDFRALIKHASANLPENGTFAQWNELCEASGCSSDTTPFA
jgi:hypothetical protein